MAEFLFAMVLSFALVSLPSLLPENVGVLDEVWRVMAISSAILATLAVSAAVNKGRGSVWALITAGLLGGVAGSSTVAIVLVVLAAIADPVGLVSSNLGLVLVISLMGVVVGGVTGTFFGAIWGYGYLAVRSRRG